MTGKDPLCQEFASMRQSTDFFNRGIALPAKIHVFCTGSIHPSAKLEPLGRDLRR
jgi:hypothetical protein